MTKEFQYICWECEAHFSTRDKDNPLCRQCTQKLWRKNTELNYKEVVVWAITLYGKPQPTPLQAAKWRRGRKAKKMMDERQEKINKQSRNNNNRRTL